MLGQCSVTASNLVFGSYTQGQVADLLGSTSVSIICTNGTGFEVGIDGGLNTGGIFAGRAMSGGTPAGGADLEYDLTDPTNGNAVIGAQFGLDTIGAGLALTGNAPAANIITVDGVIPGGQTTNPGAFTDTVNIIVFF